MPARKGEEHHGAKLTEREVNRIRFSPGKVKEIARQFGVSPGLVSQIKSGHVWRWLPRMRHRERPAP